MNARLKIAYWCYIAAMAGPAIWGAMYLTRSEFMPYHSVAAGVSWSSVPPGLQVLVLGLLKLAGASWLTTAVAVIIILQFPFRAGAAWARWAVPVVALLHYAGVAIAMAYVASNSPAQPPWAATLAGAVLVLAGAVLSRGSRANAPPAT